MTLKARLQGIAASNQKRDEEKLIDFCRRQANCSAIGSALARQDVNLVGEITSLRIVPRAGSPSLEATLSDGTGSVVAVWTGRRRVAGVAPGKRLVVSGRGAPIGPGGRLLFLNPRYELL